MKNRKKSVILRVTWSIFRFYFFISLVSRCVLISTISSLVSVPISIASSKAGLKICSITALIKGEMSITKKKKKKQGKIMLLQNPSWILSNFFFLKSQLISYINYDAFVSASNVLKEYDEMKEEIKSLSNAIEYTI